MIRVSGAGRLAHLGELLPKLAPLRWGFFWLCCITAAATARRKGVSPGRSMESFLLGDYGLCCRPRPLDRVSGPPALGVVADTAEWSDRRPCAVRSAHPFNASTVPGSWAEIRLCCPGWRIGAVQRGPRSVPACWVHHLSGRSHAASTSPKAGHGAHVSRPRPAQPNAGPPVIYRRARRYSSARRWSRRSGCRSASSVALVSNRGDVFHLRSR